VLAAVRLQNSDGLVLPRSNSGFVATIRVRISVSAPEWNSSNVGCARRSVNLCSINHHRHVGGTGGRKHEIERVARVPDAPLTLNQRVPGSSPGAPTN
jgi:hypothetical protein